MHTNQVKTLNIKERIKMQAGCWKTTMSSSFLKIFPYKVFLKHDVDCHPTLFNKLPDCESIMPVRSQNQAFDKQSLFWSSFITYSLYAVALCYIKISTAVWSNWILCRINGWWCYQKCNLLIQKSFSNYRITMHPAGKCTVYLYSSIKQYHTRKLYIIK